MMKIFFINLLVLIATHTYAQKITHLERNKTVSIDQLLKGDLEGKTLVFGEYHYDRAILNAHAKLIWRLIQREQFQNDFTVGWEFLEYDHAAVIDKAFVNWKKAKITDEQYLKLIFPNSKQPLQHLPYLNFMAATAKLGGKLVATNATRETKKDLMDKGIGALQGKDIPDQMLNGSKDYYKRFLQIMGNHVPQHLLKKYFLAQYYTDNIIGTYLERNSGTKVSFLIIGSFHSDYNDGVVRYLKTYSRNDVISFKIVNKSKITEEDLSKLYRKDPNYGFIADYLIEVE